MASSSTEDDDEIDEHANSLLLIIMFGTHFIFFLLTYFWLYPPDESPKTARMRRLGTDIERCRITGETMRPNFRLSTQEINLLCRYDRISWCPERSYLLSEEDQKTLQVAREGEVHYLKDPAHLKIDPTLNYGSLIVNRGVPIEKKGLEKGLEIEALEEEAAVEDLVPLRRPKEAGEKQKKRKTKERMDALDQLTRGQSAERIPLFSRIIPGGHGHTLKQAPSIHRTLEVQTTVEEDKTIQRAPRKSSKKPSASEVNVKKKKSATMKEGRQLTLREELSVARTIEETTNKRNTSSREPILK